MKFYVKVIKFDYNFMAGITYMLAWDSIVVDGMSSKSFYISKWLSGRAVVSWYLSFKIWRAIQLHIIWLAKSILCRREQLYLATFFDTWAFSKWFDISVVTVSINLWPKNLSIVKKTARKYYSLFRGYCIKQYVTLYSNY